jgi:hypothetical protein
MIEWYLSYLFKMRRRKKEKTRLNFKLLHIFYNLHFFITIFLWRSSQRSDDACGALNQRFREWEKAHGNIAWLSRLMVGS